MKMRLHEEKVKEMNLKDFIELVSIRELESGITLRKDGKYYIVEWR